MHGSKFIIDEIFNNHFILVSSHLVLKPMMSFLRFTEKKLGGKFPEPEAKDKK